MARRTLFLFLLVMPSLVALAADQATVVIRSEKATVPAFVAVKGLEASISQSDYEKVVKDIAAHVELRRALYRVDGNEVSAYVARRKDRRGKLPVVILNRGGHVDKTPLPYILGAVYRYADAGFLVIAPMLRGSDGQPGKDEMGGADFADLRVAVEHVADFGEADSDNVFMAGESRGGVMTLLAAHAHLPIRAAVVWGAITDMGEYLSHVDPGGKIAHAVWTDFDQNKEEILKTRSALDWVSDLQTPLLIMQGNADQTVDPLQALRFATELQKNNKTYQLIVFAGDNHTLRNHQLERDRQAIDWFRKYLKIP